MMVRTKVTMPLSSFSSYLSANEHYDISLFVLVSYYPPFAEIDEDKRNFLTRSLLGFFGHLAV